MNDQHHGIVIGVLINVADRPIDDDHLSVDDDADPAHIIHGHHALFRGIDKLLPLNLNGKSINKFQRK